LKLNISNIYIQPCVLCSLKI